MLLDKPVSSDIETLTMSDDIKVPLTSSDPIEGLVEQLNAVAPQAFTDGRIDLDKLKQLLGDKVEEGVERYGLNWAGKAEAFRNVQQSSVGTLLPMTCESVNWDSTKHQVIEGDNLEVLKLMQKTYHSKVRMIYIDPPYNTGSNEFIYADNFRDSLDEYLRYTGQVDVDGEHQSTRKDSSGRHHSSWLNMMYPRLFLARNLLREDGVIFISIDDNEVHNLRMLMNEIFGEENFVATIIWQKVFAPKNSAKHFSEDHEYCLVFARNADYWKPELLPRTEEMEARYTNRDDDPRGKWASDNLTARNYYGEGTYSVQCPSGRVISGPPTGTYWRVSKTKFLELDRDNRIWWGDSGDNMPRLKRFLDDVQGGRVPQTLWTYKEVGHTQEAKKDLISLIKFSDSREVFDTPKPSRLITQMLRIATQPNNEDIVLDFFAGSGTTAQAVMSLNKEDGGNRRYILVQLPEKSDSKQFPTIAHLTRERVRKVIRKFSIDNDGQLELQQEQPQDFGFRAFRLAKSNFKIWDSKNAPTDEQSLTEQLRLYSDNIDTARTEQDILYEIILKAGLDISEPVTVLSVADSQVFSISNGDLVVCLDTPIDKQVLRGVIELAPRQMVCLDKAFSGNDPLKTNTVLEAKSHNIVFKTI